MSRALIAIAALLAAFAAAPVLAQDDGKLETVFPTEALPGPRGVFEGSIGRYPIIACFDARYDGDGFGSYYYLSQMKPIPLAANEAKNRWSEGSAYTYDVDDGAPFWNVRMDKSGNFVGTWRNEKRTYPIRLTRIATGAKDYEGACGTDSFLKPRLGTPQFTQTAASLGGFEYTKLNFQSPAHFPEVRITGFRFQPSQPGDAAINQKLGLMLPAGSPQDDYVQCMAGNLIWRGIDGDYEMDASPRFANDQLLSVETQNGSYCGGAHPNYWQEYFLYDRQSGEHIDAATWFNDTALAASEYGSQLMQEPLRTAIVARWLESLSDDIDPDCKDLLTDHEYWQFQMLAGGISFQPNLPHVATACEDRILLSWDEVAPFLSGIGRDIRNRAGQ